MRRNWINRTTLLLCVMVLTGCATSADDMLTHSDAIMLDIWQQNTAGGAGAQSNRLLLDARQQLRRPLTEQTAVHQTGYTRTAENEINHQFHRLPNPDLVMYVFPHLAGSDPVPVPGYSTVFPLYQRIQYAMPGERVEDY